MLDCFKNEDKELRIMGKLIIGVVATGPLGFILILIQRLKFFVLMNQFISQFYILKILSPEIRLYEFAIRDPP